MLGLETAKDWATDVACQWEQVPPYQVDPKRLRHLAVICDGNRRAALNYGFEPQLGHLVGIEVTKGIARAARAWNIRYLTLWVWSTENWKRDKEQSDFVMEMAEDNLSKEQFLEELIGNGVRFTHLGRKERLPTSLQGTLALLEESTESLGRYWLNLSLDYGGRDEIIRAIEKRDCLGKEGGIEKYLDTAGQPNVDLVIRTGVNGRDLPHTSGFMPLQTADAAWIFLPNLFPDLSPDKLLQSVQKFEGYNRRLGR